MTAESVGRPTRTRGKPPENVIPEVAGLWATYIKQNIPGLMVTAGAIMAPGQQTTCTMAWGGNTYNGSSNSGMHGEVDCLNQAYDAGENLQNGTFQALTNPVCMVCCAVLYSVGITNVPAMAGASKEYGNYSLPAWIFDDEAPGGLLNRLLGNAAFTQWTTELSAESRGKQVHRQSLITQMTQKLIKH
ncbi:hypothetical protein ACFOY2_47000 [Nonomuraea purpurea]|uniref:Uncharacterized protein n=1 Tax=Nonomuraea purpurea TaxID=1849276 RepID=A0ABV8GLK3_9ACTN